MGRWGCLRRLVHTLIVYTSCVHTISNAPYQTHHTKRIIHVPYTYHTRMVRTIHAPYTHHTRTIHAPYAPYTRSHPSRV
jgi:hypothetical protein